MAIFNLDGTLVRPLTYELLPGVQTWFGMRPTRLAVAIATNQGGVAMRHHYAYDTLRHSQYPTAEKAGQRVFQVARLLNIPPSLVFMSFAYKFSEGIWVDTPRESLGNERWSRNWRKPNAGMLMAAIGRSHASPQQTVMIGNSDDDRLAAARAGVTFIPAKTFFGWREGMAYEPHFAYATA
ncbi:MAG: HAD hydrolase-like protein [Anaerolinea sp.]|nr:HAD hydrolase-like protein [Anaerolinea sp.]